MLKSLRVRNLAVAENVLVEFEPGLNVVTGETGAGKSLLVGALALLLGDRADRTLIRAGEDQCVVEGVFDLAKAGGVDSILAAFGLPTAEEGRLVLRRIVRVNGTGAVYVNDSPATVQALRQLGDELVDLHGPHDHQSLFRTSAQMEILDAFGECAPERAAWAETFGRIAALQRRRSELTMDEAALAREMDLLEDTVREIAEAAPEEGEEERIRTEHEVAGSAQRILELAGQAASLLTESESCAFSALASAQRPLEELGRLLPAAAEWRAEAARLASAVQELGMAIAREAGSIEVDPARLEWLDRRLGVYQRLRRKYGGTVAEILATLESSRQRLEDLRSRVARLAEIDAELEGLRAELHRRGEALRVRRTAAAVELAEAVTGELEFLGFPGSAFRVDLEPAEPQADGMDRVDFMFAPNVGEAMRPLRLIASSGEISRVMLAIKAVVAAHDRIPVLVFDEIDANLGGEMGHAVGRELAGVAEMHQVICITHLPQVAVHGDAHRVARKTVRDGRTYTEVAPVEGDERIEELARMLGGGDSRAALAHAAEMLQRARHGR